MKNFYVILILTSFITISLMAQNTVTVHGIVSDQNKETLIGVTIQEVGTTNGTITDINGRYSISVTANSKVRFTYMGYKPVEITVTSPTEYNITMVEDFSQLDEIVIVAYGTQRKKDLTGAISVVDTKTIEKQLMPGIGQALQGLATGVRVTSSGRPGSGADIIIRGIGSFRNSAPLYVIDGMILEESQREFNMNDIESIQILKDASATALYGARAANGVILITTKRGGSGETKIRFTGTYGVSQIAKRYETMNSLEFLRINRLAYQNANRAWPGEPEQGQVLINTDWQDEFFKTGITQDYNLNVSGGNTNGNYMFSFGYYDEEGVVIGPTHERLTMRSNAEAKKGIFTVGENLMVGRSTTKVMQGNPFIDLARMPPIIPVRDPDNPEEYGFGSSSYQTYGTNPIGLQETRDHRQYNLRLIGSAFMQIEPIKGLQLKTNLGIEYLNWYDNYKTTYKQLRYLEGAFDHDTQLQENNGDMQSWLWENTAIYKKSIGKHEFDVLFGYSAQKSERRGNSVTGYDIVNEGFWVIKQASSEVNARPTIYGDKGVIAMTSIFGRINYQFAGKYILQANLRRDASSLFGENYRSGNFPGVSLGWRISEESFMNSLTWINDLKFRASFGVSGNQAAVPAYSFATYIEGGRGAVFGEPPQYYQGQIQIGMANKDLRWESRTTYNIGLDFSILNQHLYGSFEYFEARLNDLLVNKEIAWIYGTDVSPWINYGKINNKGIELSIGYRENNSAFTYDVSLNLTATRNKVVNLGNDTFYFDGIGGTSHTQTGRSMGEFYVLRTDGIFQNMNEVYAHSITRINELTGDEELVLIQPQAMPGDIRYKDLNGDGVISNEDREFIGSPFSKFDGGLNFSCAWKGFDLNLFFFGVYGNMIFNNTKFWMERLDETANLPKNLKPWNGEGTSNTTPRPYMNPTDNTIVYSDRWVEKGDYLRLKNIQLGYSIPVNLLKRTQVIETFRLYAGVQNLFTITGYSGLDPEISGGGLFSKGYDDGHFPPVRTFTCGLQISF